MQDDVIGDDFVLPPGSAKRGAKLFKKHCQQCHSMRPDNRQPSGFAAVGPSLFNVYNRTAGIDNATTNTGFSTSLDNVGIIWNDTNLMRYLKNPRAYVQSPIAMNFAGLAKFQDRVDIIHFLKTLTYDHEFGKSILRDCMNKTR